MKKIASFFLIPIACLALSCNKEGGEGGNGGTPQLGVSVKDLPELVEVPENQTQTFELTVTSDPGPSQAMYVTVGTDETLVDAYNLENGTSYEMIPAAAYEISSTPLMLMRFNKNSAPGTLKLKGTGCELDETYLLPLVVDQVKGDIAYEAPAEKVVYVLFKMTEAQILGTGTETDPYQVDGLETFKKMGNVLKDGETVYLKLTTDIDFAGAGWEPIDTEKKAIFLDGDNHTVKNIAASAGMFVVLNGTVQNLKIDAAEIEAGAELAGVLAERGASGVTVKNVTITNSSISNSGYTGGLMGRLTAGTIENVSVDVDVTGNERTAGFIGHIVDGTFTKCVASGDVTGVGYYAGGFVGMFANGTMTECSASGNVTSTRDNYARAGGLIGQMYCGTLTKCHATGNVSCLGHYGGGLIGVIEGTVKTDNVVTETKTIAISKCYSTGDVQLPPEAGTRKSGAGGLIGFSDGGNVSVSDCYCTGKVTGYRWSSGFIGNIGNSTYKITNCYTSSDISGIFLEGAFGMVIGNNGEADTATNKVAGTATATGLIAWSTSTVPFTFPDDLLSTTGNYYGAEGTLSAKAKELGWDETVWDLTADVPVLK